MVYNPEVLLVYANYTSRSLHPPLGLAYIAGCLIQRGISVKILDCSFFKNYHEFSRAYAEYSPRIVGISFLSSMTEGAYEIARRIKEKNKETLVVAGGPHATVFKEECLKNKNIDAIVIGEGELTFPETVKTFQKAGSAGLRNIKGVFYKRRKGEFARNELRTPLTEEELNNLPMPAYELLPQEYFSGRFSIISSRGCPFQCNYCQPTQKMIFGLKYKFESAQRVSKIIDYLINQKGISYLIFEDDTFTVMEKRVREICDEILRQGFNKKIHFRCHLRARPFPGEETLEKMRQAGFTNISVGFESGNQEILDLLGKGTTVEDNIRAGLALRKLGFKIFAYIMLGAPGETEKSLKDTWKMIRKIKPFEVRVSVTTPLPGTKLEEYCRQKGILNEAISEKERYHYDSFEELPIKLDIKKELLIKYKKKIENYVRWRRIISKVRKNPLKVFNYGRIILRKAI